MLRTRLPCLVILILSLLVSRVGRGETTGVRELPRVESGTVGLSADELEKIDGAVGQLLERRVLPGAVVAVARRGRIAFLRAYGKRHVDRGEPMELDTILRIYSMSKPITSVALMTLWEEGKFRLDDPVSRHIPEFRDVRVYGSGGDGEPLETEPPRREPTVADLLRHTAGLGYGNTSGPVAALYRQAALGQRDGLRAFVGALAGIPLFHHPGERWNYGYAVDVQGYLIELLSGVPLDRFLRERIFEPLDMRDTGFRVPAADVPRFAANHEHTTDEGFRIVDEPAESRYLKPPPWPSGGGGLVSTVRDYLRFAQMLLDGGHLGGARILRRSTVDRMTRNQLDDVAFPIGFGSDRWSGVGFGYGFSVRVAPSESSPAEPPGEYGWSGLASTHFWISPQDDLVVVALSQRLPYSNALADAVKPIVYDAIEDRTEGRTRF